jgi:hypothetical protein
MRAKLDDAAPDLICLTEGHENFLAAEGHLITADPDFGYSAGGTRRKVLLWSRSPWTGVDQVGHPTLPGGRYIKGWTETPLGPLQVFGVCIPWAQAHVSGGRRDRKPWEDHLAFLTGLAEVLPTASHDGRSVLLGDFNQSIPRTRAPKSVHEALMRALPEGMQVATEGLIPDLGLRSIDHLAHTTDLTVTAVQGLSKRSPDGHRLSDHFGLLVQLGRRA